MKMVQQDVFTAKRQADLKSTNIVKDEQHILRVRTKIAECTDEEGFLHPMLLPSKHKLTELIILSENMSLLCRMWNHTEKPEKTILALEREKNRKKVPLLEDRVRETAVFEVTGVDLAGPLVLNGGKKVWMVLFTCDSLSKKVFLFALRRFISHRGRLKIIYSNNGTHFVGTNNLLDSKNLKNIETEAAPTFNPPSAACWGGWWEYLIQMIEKLLRRILRRATLHYEELLSVICEC
ncbi:hypothetical protein PR048_025959 [Dryococelus australis]|uniref:Integrase catalytic domain-containing protein n=1 Tax=Dryococelus australis TaxID=614101 RepID=A0ABQ9GJZ8_9NEOP|nr:hypothetical protein PR048_025959 [Dryococelus australis]